ncbi:MAG: hypothetical protein AAF623_19630, partial [Planctomycetota bacterium]
MSSNNRILSYSFYFLIVSVLALTGGCKSGAFSKPDFGSLAFWKQSGSASELPPPPARHFDPAPLGESPQMADKGSSNRSGSHRSNTMDLDQSKLVERIKSEIAVAKRDLQQSKSELNGSPDRKPYSMDRFASSTGGSGSGTKPLSSNSFRNAFSSESNGFQPKQKSAEPGLTSAQKDFQAALSGISNSGSQINQSLSQAANSFQTKAELARTKTTVDQSLKSVNQSLSSAADRISNEFNRSRAKASDTFGGVADSVTSKVGSDVKQFAGSINEKANSFIGKASKSLSQLSPLKKSLDENKFGFDPYPTPKSSPSLANGSDSRLAANGFSPRKDAFAIRAPKSEPSPPESLAASKASRSAEATELERVKAEMDLARQQIESLKMQIAKKDTPQNNPVSNLSGSYAQLKTPNFGGL